MKKAIKLLCVLIAIFTAAFFVRSYHLESLPINHDEARWARVLLRNPEIGGISDILIAPFFSYFPSYIQPFIVNHIPKHSITNFKELIIYLRMHSAIAGAVTVLLVYLLAGRMYGKVAAGIASFILCFLPWHIIQSRIMGRVIWVPLFGCLIFLSLFKSGQVKNRIYSGFLFLLACFFLKDSLNGYQAAVLFIPIFLASLVFVYNRKESLGGIKKTICASAVVLLFIAPFIYKIVSPENKFLEDFYRFYHLNIFEGSIFHNLAQNFKNNISCLFHQLFFAHRASSFLYGQALNAPLLIHPIALILFLLSLILAIFQRKIADKILMSWILLGSFGAVAGISLFQDRYIFIILPPVVILVGRFIAYLFYRMSFSKTVYERKILLITGVVSLCVTAYAEIIQWAGYYYNAPFELKENIHNSYGCEDAAEYLNRIPDIMDYKIITDARMTVDIYLNCLLLGKHKIDRYYNFIKNKSGASSKGVIFVLWAPQSHSKDYWNGLFRYTYDHFRQEHPFEAPMKIIYYPNGLEAVFIFKVKQAV